MLEAMRALVLVLLGTLVFPLQAAESPFLLSYAQWAVPRQGEALRAMPALRHAMDELRDRPAGRLLIRHPGGEQGVLWAHELQSWLVALGVGSQRIELRPGSPEPTALSLEVVPGRVIAE